MPTALDNGRRSPADELMNSILEEEWEIFRIFANEVGEPD
jgi:hypothetical protein